MSAGKRYPSGFEIQELMLLIDASCTVKDVDLALAQMGTSVAALKVSDETPRTIFFETIMWAKRENRAKEFVARLAAIRSADPAWRDLRIKHGVKLGAGVDLVVRSDPQGFIVRVFLYGKAGGRRRRLGLVERQVVLVDDDTRAVWSKPLISLRGLFDGVDAQRALDNVSMVVRALEVSDALTRAAPDATAWDSHDVAMMVDYLATVFDCVEVGETL